MLTPGRTTGAGLRRRSGFSQRNSGPGDLSGERGEFIDRIAYRRDRLSSTEGLTC
jgi:hypothetical protein